MRSNRSGRAIRDTAPAGAFAGIAMAVLCPYLARSGHPAAAWIVGSVLGAATVWLLGGAIALDLDHWWRDRDAR